MYSGKQKVKILDINSKEYVEACANFSKRVIFTYNEIKTISSGAGAYSGLSIEKIKSMNKQAFADKLQEEVSMLNFDIACTADQIQSLEKQIIDAYDACVNGFFSSDYVEFKSAVRSIVGTGLLKIDYSKPISRHVLRCT
jgi:hypothetical protein